MLRVCINIMLIYSQQDRLMKVKARRRLLITRTYSNNPIAIRKVYDI